MLGLKSDTDVSWVKIAEGNLQQLLTDHAFAEQKAAAAAVSLIINYSEETELVQRMSDLAIEEMEHFKMVHEIMVSRGMTLGQDQRSDYAKHLSKFFLKTKDRQQSLINRLLMGAIIEARSCERFSVLSKNMKDKELAKFFGDLLASEAGHYTLFLGFARKFMDREVVDKTWDEFLTYEAEYIKQQGKLPLVHG
ncbi:MAG: tRNA-(ms[2]io[6]A)-hydroxylase [Bacteroidota bacterium]